MTYKNYDSLEVQQKLNEIDNKCEKDYVDEKVSDINSSLEDIANNKADKSEVAKKATIEQLNTKASKEDVANISSGTPLFASTVAEMTDTTKNYVNTTDGYLYIYNSTSSSFKKSEVLYQSTGINDNSITLDKMSYKYMSMFRGNLIINFKENTITFNNFDFVGQDCTTHYSKTDDFNSVVDISSRDKDVLYFICVTRNTEYKLTGLRLVKFGEITNLDYVLMTLTNEQFNLPFTTDASITVIDSNGRKKYNPRLSWIFVNDVDAITIDKKNKIISFPNESLVISTQDYSTTWAVNNLENIDISSLNEGNVNILYFDTVDSKIKISEFNSLANNVYIICAFKINSDFLLKIGDGNSFKIIGTSGEQEYPRGYKNIPNFNNLSKISGCYPNDKDSIVINKKENMIYFSSSIVLKTFDSSKTFSISNHESISISGLNKGWVYVLYMDVTDNKIKLSAHNAVPKINVYFICSFKASEPILYHLGSKDCFKVISANGEQEYPNREYSFPKQLNMPHYVEAKNIDESYFENYYFLGRWAKKTINSTECMYTPNLGSEIYAKVKNTTTVSINFLSVYNTSGNPTEIAYSIDGGDFVRDSVDNCPFVVNNLDLNEHYVRIVIAGNKDSDNVWSENQGIAFKSIEVDSGGEIKAVKPKARVGMFYGDSITAGCWLLDRTVPSQGYAAEQNYVYKCCEKLNCINVRVAFSAAGVTLNGAGGVPKFLEIIDKMDSETYEKSLNPDFIVINLGTNDGASTSEVFTQKYQEVINRIERKYPGVIIFVMRPFIGRKETEIKSIAMSSKNTVYVDTTDWNVECIDSAHPNAMGSITAGNKLAEFILNYFGKSYFLV